MVILRIPKRQWRTQKSAEGDGRKWGIHRIGGPEPPNRIVKKLISNSNFFSHELVIKRSIAWKKSLHNIRMHHKDFFRLITFEVDNNTSVCQKSKAKIQIIGDVDDSNY